jgi:hypothetical protein
MRKKNHAPPDIGRVTFLLLPQTPTMADRERCVASTACPGDVVNHAKQKRQTPEEIQAAKQAADLAKIEKADAAASKTKKGVKRAAAAVADLAAQDKVARATAARPDLVTAQLKRDVVEKTQQAAAKVSKSWRMHSY